MLGIGKNQVYQLFNSGAFKTISIGSRKLVSKVVFENWLAS